MLTVLEGTNETVKVKNDAFDREVEVDRVIDKIEGSEPGPVHILLAGIHGNEPAGLYALYDVMKEIRESDIPVRGSIYGFVGNLKALRLGERFLKEDLNRMWLQKDIDGINSGEINESTPHPERQEQLELWGEIQKILNTKRGPFYFIDLHTTSSQSTPFLIFNDSITNRDFASQFPLPMILGIEEHLEGPLLSYINEIGHVAMGIESGQHYASESVDYHHAFIKLALVNAGNIRKEDLKDFQKCYKTLAEASPDRKKVFEIKYRYAISEGEGFQMKPGFTNFQPVQKDELLAENKKGEITSHLNGRIFMPAYQSLGEDGYFLVQQVSRFWLKVSKGLRRFKFEVFLRMLPGVKRHPRQKEVLIVNLGIARFLATDIFHLLGFRRKLQRGNKLWFIRRKYDLRPPESPLQND